MPTNKNAFLRIRILDGLLSESAVRHYTMSQMIELCNKKLRDSDEEIVGRRCIERLHLLTVLM